MTDEARRTIAELCCRYEFEPDIVDVIVEGQFDVDVLSRCIDSDHINKPTIYHIDTVDVPNELLTKYGLSDGNKQRVIALAKEMNLNAALDNSSYLCFVDKDLDEWLGEILSVKKLCWTKYTSLELYFYSAAFLEEILLVMAKCKIKDWSSFNASFIEVLKNIFACRLVSKYLDLNVRFVSYDKYIKRENDILSFDSGSFIKNSLMNNSLANRCGDFISSHSDWCNRMNGLEKAFIHGHDFVDLISWCIKSFKGVPEFNSPRAIERIFVLVAPDKIKQEIKEQLGI